MREHLYRIKDFGEWFYGFPIAKREFHADDEFIGFAGYDELGQRYYNIAAYPETLSEFTGVYDRNGKRIFEGDILEGTVTSRLSDFIQDKIRCVVEYVCFQYGGGKADVKFESVETRFGDRYGLIFARDCEVIGNKWDNADLLRR